MHSVAIIGTGRVGTALGIALFQKGYRISGVASRTSDKAQKVAGILNTSLFDKAHELTVQSDIVFITTPDMVISDLTSTIAAQGGFRNNQVVIHTSGAYSSELLASAKTAGSWVASMHPLQTFSGTEKGLDIFKDSYFAVEGDEGALPIVNCLVNSLGGKLIRIPTELKPLYHAAASVVCNYLVTLIDQGLLMMEETGVSRDIALKALSPLIETTFRNIKEMGTHQALTGPIERGDEDTVAAHMALIKGFLSDSLAFYRVMGRYTVELAENKGSLDKGKGERLKKMMEV